MQEDLPEPSLEDLDRWAGSSGEPRRTGGPRSATRTWATFALLMVVLALLMLTLLTVYFFLHRIQDLEDIEMQPEEEPPKSGAVAA